jgi:hypothetical protein
MQCRKTGQNLSLALTLRMGGEKSFLAGNGQRRVSTALRDLGHTAVKFWVPYVKPQTRDAELFSHFSYKIEKEIKDFKYHFDANVEVLVNVGFFNR